MNTSKQVKESIPYRQKGIIVKRVKIRDRVENYACLQKGIFLKHIKKRGGKSLVGKKTFAQRIKNTWRGRGADFKRNLF